MAAGLLAGGAVVPSERAPRPALADLAWMEGHWEMDADGGRAEEIWMAPFDGSMVGSFRWVVPGRMHVLELLIIEETNGEVTFRFKHFDRDFRAWEEGEANTYRLVEVRDREAVFLNVAWSGRVPQRLTYSMPEPDRLLFRGESPDGEGEALVLEFRRRQTRSEDVGRP